MFLCVFDTLSPIKLGILLFILHRKVFTNYELFDIIQTQNNEKERLS